MIALLLLACAAHTGVAGAVPAPAAYAIDGRPVSRADWEAQRARLVGDEADWSCAETTTGGRVSYRMRDAEGRWWRVQEISDSAGGDRYLLTRDDAG